MWHSIKNPPTKPGVYAVAHFEGDKMINYNPNWACYDGYFGPNNLTYSAKIDPTHWIEIGELMRHIEELPKEGEKREPKVSKFLVRLGGPIEFTTVYAHNLREAWKNAEKVVGKKRLIAVRYCDDD